MSKNEMIMLPREVVEQVLDTLNTTHIEAFMSKRFSSIESLRAAIDRPQRKLTQQDIADSALLGNIESQFNACMHQEHCKRWKSQAGADSSLRAAVQQACDWISEEPGRRPISAGRLLAILTNALAAAPKPPVVENMHTNPDPYLYYDPANGDTWTQEAIDYGFLQPDGLIALYTRPHRTPLTDERIDACFPVQWEGEFYKAWRQEVGRSIERAHGIGG